MIFFFTLDDTFMDAVQVDTGQNSFEDIRYP